MTFKFVDFLKNNSFIKNTSILASGIFSSQLISITTSPIISRIYTPSDFGTLHIFLSLLSILIVISTLKLELAIPLPKKDEVAFQLLIIGMISILFFSIITTFFCYSMKSTIINLFSLEKIDKYFFLLPVGIFFAGLYLILNYWAIRKREFKKIATTKLTQVILGISTQIGLGIIGLKPSGLLIGSIVKRAIGFIPLLKIVLRDRNFIFQITSRKMFDTIKMYKKFPLISTQSGLLNNFGISLPILLFAHFFSVKNVGYFSLTLFVVSVPVTTVGQSISQVFISDSAIFLNSDIKKLKQLYVNIIKHLFYISIVPSIIFILWSPKIFPILFGSNWLISGKIAQYLTIMYTLQFITVPTSQLLTIMEKQELQFLWDILRLFVIILSIYIPFIRGASFLSTIFYYGIAMSIMYCFLILLQLNQFNKIIKLMYR